MAPIKKFVIYTRLSLLVPKDARPELASLHRYKTLNALAMTGRQSTDEYFGEYEIGQTHEKSRRPRLYEAIKLALDSGSGLAVSNLARIGRDRLLVKLIFERLKIPVFVTDLRREISVDEALQITERNLDRLNAAQRARDRAAGIQISDELGTDCVATRFKRRSRQDASVRRARRRARRIRTYFGGHAEAQADSQ
jgi:hypothetical protein